MTVHMDEAHDQAQLLARLRQFMFWLLLASVTSLIALVALAADPDQLRFVKSCPRGLHLCLRSPRLACPLPCPPH